jgi:hypothetical protein
LVSETYDLLYNCPPTKNAGQLTTNGTACPPARARRLSSELGEVSPQQCVAAPVNAEGSRSPR